jgi:hypothetical protein
MQFVKIQIPDRDECSKAFAALIRRGRIDCYQDNTFVIPEPGLQLLQDMGISYIELGRGGFDLAVSGILSHDRSLIRSVSVGTVPLSS